MRTPDELWLEMETSISSKKTLKGGNKLAKIDGLFVELIATLAGREKILVELGGGDGKYLAPALLIAICRVAAEQHAKQTLTPEVVREFLAKLPKSSGEGSTEVDLWVWLLRAWCRDPAADAEVHKRFLEVAKKNGGKAIRSSVASLDGWKSLPKEERLHLLDRLGAGRGDDELREEYRNWGESLRIDIRTEQRKAARPEVVEVSDTPAPDAKPVPPAPVTVATEPAPPDKVAPISDSASQVRPPSQEPVAAVEPPAKKKPRPEPAAGASVDFSSVVNAVGERVASDIGPMVAAVERMSADLGDRLARLERGLGNDHRTEIDKVRRELDAERESLAEMRQVVARLTESL